MSHKKKTTTRDRFKSKTTAEIATAERAEMILCECEDDDYDVKVALLTLNRVRVFHIKLRRRAARKLNIKVYCAVSVLAYMYYDDLVVVVVVNSFCRFISVLDKK